MTQPNQQANGQQHPLQSNAPGDMKALFAAFARHGKPLRGLMAAADKPTFQGRFGRMFADTIPAGTYGATDDESRKALLTLGALMTSKLDEPKDGGDAEESGIPVLYTYFALDLDNVYGRGPDDQPYLYDDSGLKFLLGEVLDNGAHDLQRNTANTARALIGDPRNDENSIISQFQALMLRFHNRLVDEYPGLNFASIQKIVRWHYQWVVVNDFLPRIISSRVLDALKTNGIYDRKKIQFFHWKKTPFMPVEFSAAAYRLGHSMIRPGYRLNDDDTTMLPIFPVPDTAMAKNRGIDWGRFIDVGEPRPYGAEIDDETSPSSNETKRRLQLAYRLDTSVVTPLSVLPKSVAFDEPRSLAQRNLLRGFELGLPTGQNVAKAMGLTPLSDREIIIGKAVDRPEGDDRVGPLSDIPELSAFRGNCPLWTYILAEAALPKNIKPVTIPVTPPRDISTPQLGEVGGRIVAEVFLGLLFGDKHSFLSVDPRWTPTIGSAKSEFGLRDIVSFALGS
ncbi:hypothetical protein B0A52_06438 [Exophiala mesophila]|uniref:Heme peroxidase n=1 Tax=Exophiala mesophila TaxID=212818 RepID=A0A438N2J6_EXOME|nr:hypothetical protein B0A52_06438 [Exophiala mesophila]